MNRPLTKQLLAALATQRGLPPAVAVWIKRPHARATVPTMELALRMLAVRLTLDGVPCTLAEATEKLLDKLPNTWPALTARTGIPERQARRLLAERRFLLVHALEAAAHAAGVQLGIETVVDPNGVQ